MWLTTTCKTSLGDMMPVVLPDPTSMAGSAAANFGAMEYEAVGVDVSAGPVDILSGYD